MKKKIIYSEEYLNDLSPYLACPYCFKNLMINNNSLVCNNKHTFDISKKGTTILCKNSKVRKDKIYNNNLFINRRNFINKGFYDDIHQSISEIINKFYKNRKLFILDMGCGEGTHDFKISKSLISKSYKLLGLDLSKDGIDLFNDYVSNNMLGIVSDLNYVPIQNNSVDIILNILSPSNEEEMARILKEDGIIIKVTPKKEYLHELRDILNIRQYENEDIISGNITQKYNVVQRIDYIKKFSLDDDSYKYLINMTPLLSNYDNIPRLKEVTIALNIYVMEIKNEK